MTELLTLPSTLLPLLLKTTSTPRLLQFHSGAEYTVPNHTLRWEDETYVGPLSMTTDNGYMDHTIASEKHVYKGEMLQGRRHGNGQLVKIKDNAAQLYEAQQIDYDQEQEQEDLAVHTEMKRPKTVGEVKMLPKKSAHQRKVSGSANSLMREDSPIDGLTDMMRSTKFDSKGDHPFTHSAPILLRAEISERPPRTIDTSEILMSYQGQWKAGVPHGQGTKIYNQEGTAKYIGQFENGQRSGHGTMYYSSGNKYAGEWRNDLQTGEGKMIWQKSNESYSGSWKDGLQHGFGEHVWHRPRRNFLLYPYENQYSGEWVKGKRHGQGRFLYATGERYDGEWAANMKHGKATFTYENGRQFKGQFCMDRQVDYKHTYRTESPYNFSQAPQATVNSEHANDRLNILINRHKESLINLYKSYSKPLSRGHAVDAFNFWRMTRDIGLWTCRKSVTSICRAMTTYDNKNIHDDSRILTFYDFLNSLIKVAILVRDGLENSALETGAGGCFEHIIYNHIHRAEAESNPSAQEALEDSFRRPLVDLYCHYVTKKRQPDSDSLTIREVIQLLNNQGVLDKHRDLSATMLLKVVLSVIPLAYDSQHFRQNAEVSAYEFMMIMLRITQFKRILPDTKPPPVQSVPGSASPTLPLSTLITKDVKEIKESGMRRESESAKASREPTSSHGKSSKSIPTKPSSTSNQAADLTTSHVTNGLDMDLDTVDDEIAEYVLDPEISDAKVSQFVNEFIDDANIRIGREQKRMKE